MALRNTKSLDTHRNFDDDPLDLDGMDAPTFELGGETFHCVVQPAGGTLTRLASALGRDERGRQVYNLPDMNLFIEDCLIDETTTTTPGTPTADEPDPPEVVVVEPADDIERWRTLMADKKRPIKVKKIAEIVVWLSNFYSEDRPTQPSKR